MKKMTAKQLEGRIRKGIKKLDLRLSHEGYHTDGMVCAIGGALAYAAKTRAELDQILGSGDILEERTYGHDTARIAAKILNHGLTPRDMVLLEMGYENYALSSFIRSPDAALSNGGKMLPNTRNSFFRLGLRLREESFRPTKEA